MTGPIEHLERQAVELEREADELREAGRLDEALTMIRAAVATRGAALLLRQAERELGR